MYSINQSKDLFYYVSTLYTAIMLFCYAFTIKHLNSPPADMLMFFKTEIRVSSAAIECMSCRDSPSIEECRKTTIKCTDDQV